MKSKQEDEGEYRLCVRFPIRMGDKLRKLAEQNRRSINNEVLCLVESGMSGLAAENEKGA